MIRKNTRKYDDYGWPIRTEAERREFEREMESFRKSQESRKHRQQESWRQADNERRGRHLNPAQTPAGWKNTTATRDGFRMYARQIGNVEMKIDGFEPETCNRLGLPVIWNWQAGVISGPYKEAHGTAPALKLAVARAEAAAEKLNVKKNPASLKDRLFIGVYPSGLSYADRSREEHGDYKKLAFLSFSTLELKFYPGSKPFEPMILESAAKVQAKRGQQYQVSSTGQTVLLGHAPKSYYNNPGKVKKASTGRKVRRNPEFFRDWKDAHAHAEEKANRLGLDVAIRATKEYGRKGFSVHLASRNDSDYALTEIVKPAAGREWKRA